MSNMAQAIRMALHVGESKLGVKDIFGQDAGAPFLEANRELRGKRVPESGDVRRVAVTLGQF